jgi:type I restriction enzyme M protein
MENAEFKINKPSLLIEACKAIDAMQISSHNQDVQGDLYEYLLSRLNTAGTNGQFRTPRHIIRLMVRMLDPQVGERICDPAAGTGGFLVGAFQYILERNTRQDVLKYDADGYPHYLAGDLLTPEQHAFLQSSALAGYDNDSGMTMLRIGSMNLILHGITSPRFRYADTLSKSFRESGSYDIVFANPPFKGAIDAADVNPSLPTSVRKTEILFLHLFLRLLEKGGRAAVIVPDGVLTGVSRAHVEIRRQLVEDNRLEAVVSMPAGVFRPYAGVSTAFLIFTTGSRTDRVFFYDMEHDGFSLDDKRQRVLENDIPDILECWIRRDDEPFLALRQKRTAELERALEPLKAARTEHQVTIHRLRFEEVAAGDGERAALSASRGQAESELAELETRVAPLQAELDRLGRQFWISREQVATNKYNLSCGRYRQTQQDDVFYEDPSLTVGRLRALEVSASEHLKLLAASMAQD